MKNFPSALIKQKSTKEGIAENLAGTFRNVLNKVGQNFLNGGTKQQGISLKSINDNLDLGYEVFDVDNEIDTININNYHRMFDQNGDSINKLLYQNNELRSFNANLMNGKGKAVAIRFEDPFLFSSSVFSVINNYKYIFNSTVPDVLEHPKPFYKDEKAKDPAYYQMATIHHIVSPSLFNPYAGINVLGISEDVPLLNGKYKHDIKNTTWDNGFGNDWPGNTTSTNSEASKNKTNNQNNKSGTNSGSAANGTTSASPNQSNSNTNNNANDQEEEKINLNLNSIVDLNANADDCTIKTLVNESKGHNLGLATYRYADFMFCKDLGKVSNNHLITLRKFPGPVGDNIYKDAKPTADNGVLGEDGALTLTYPDIGRLITWFGTEDNKLEDICKFNYNASWKEFHAQIQEMPSQQQDNGVLDQIANSFSPQNNRLVSRGFSSKVGLLKYISGAIKLPIIKNNNMNTATYNWDLLRNYDQNKIYEPADTIWDTHKYEGKLTFNQEITLTFRYVLRSYSNINPKSAFLDLLANILTVTYRRGTFWGGQTKIYGPQGNNSVYKTADAFIDKAWDKLGGVWTSILNGTFNLQALQGWISDALSAAGNYLKQGVNAAGDAVGVGKTDNNKDKDKNKQNKQNKQQSGGQTQNNNGEKNKNNDTKEKLKEKAKEAGEKVTKLNKKYGWTDALKGMLKNQLGRPAMYAANSLLSGEPVGPWHLTIGNPRNPIMSMGNMIMTGAEIQHGGPLGLDDFPTELKLTVTLKHGRPRDSVEIQKMYTKGRSSIYKPMNMIQLKKYRNNPAAFGDVISVYNINGDKEQKFKTKISKWDAKQQKEVEVDHTYQSTMSDRVLAKVLRNV